MHKSLPIEDVILIEGLTEGNEKIYDYIFSHYYSGLVAFAVNKGITKDVAEDLVQEFFLKLWINRSKNKINDNLKNYLFVAIKNACYDYFRREKQKDKTLQSLPLEELKVADKPEEWLTESELKVQLDKALEKLPEKCRKIFIMSRFDGLKPDEIAQLEGISKRTVETHIGKALKILRTELKGKLPEVLITLLCTINYH